MAILALVGCASQPESTDAVRDPKTAITIDDPNIDPPVTVADMQIIERAQEILESPDKWNRADNRVCPADAKTYSLYCAIEKATVEIDGTFAHRGSAMQQARFVIDDLTASRNYDHRLMDYNNDPRTSFADIQHVFELIKARIAKKLRGMK
jgi:hypothetical protein